MHKKLPKLASLTDEEEAQIQKQIADDPDNPEWTREELDGALSLDEALPKLAESIRRSRGRPRVAAPKVAVTLRIDPWTIARFQAKGDDWRARMAKALDRAK